MAKCDRCGFEIADEDSGWDWDGSCHACFDGVLIPDKIDEFYQTIL